jgi:hypothetical protein
MSAAIPAQVREVLTEHKRAGAPFPAAWQAAVDAVRGRERDEWITALRSTADAWARAYAGVPLSRPEQAVSLIATDLEPVAATRCAVCRKSLPDQRRNRQYCSARCRRAAAE